MCYNYGWIGLSHKSVPTVGRTGSYACGEVDPCPDTLKGVGVSRLVEAGSRQGDLSEDVTGVVKTSARRG
jgi:hypothetical protein